MPPPTNPIDLTTLTAVKKWATVAAAGDDQEIQDCITAFSSWVLTRTGRGPQDGSIPSASPFVTPVSYTENYDGNGSDKMFLRNSPIQSVTTLTINGVVIPLSAAWNQTGYVITGDKKAIALRNGNGGGNAPSFTTTTFGGWMLGRYFIRGIQNVNVVYSAGYAGVPFDLEMCARKVVALNYKRTGWLGQKSQSMAHGAGTISFGDWEMDKDCERTICSYERRAMV
jgi:hypothetical protein